MGNPPHKVDEGPEAGHGKRPGAEEDSPSAGGAQRGASKGSPSKESGRRVSVRV